MPSVKESHHDVINVMTPPLLAWQTRPSGTGACFACCSHDAEALANPCWSCRNFNTGSNNIGNYNAGNDNIGNVNDGNNNHGAACILSCLLCIAAACFKPNLPG